MSPSSHPYTLMGRDAFWVADRCRYGYNIRREKWKGGTPSLSFYAAMPVEECQDKCFTTHEKSANFKSSVPRFTFPALFWIGSNLSSLSVPLCEPHFSRRREKRSAYAAMLRSGALPVKMTKPCQTKVWRYQAFPEKQADWKSAPQREGALAP